MPVFHRNPTPAPLPAPVPDPPHPLGPQSTRQVAIPPGRHYRMFQPEDVREAEAAAAQEQTRRATEAHEAKKRAHAERLAADEAARGKRVQAATAAHASAANELANARLRLQGAINAGDTAGAVRAQQELALAANIERMTADAVASTRAAR